MAYVEDKNKLKNKFQIVGYLKESDLKVTRDPNTRKEVISGSITVATKDDMEFRLFCYAARYRELKQGQTTPELNPTYDKLFALTPDNATSLAKIIAMDPNATLESSKESITKVFCAGEITERFFVGKDNETHESIQLRPSVAQKASDKFFSPKAIFEADIYVDGVFPEQDKETKEETGRYILKGTMLRYDNVAICVDFVTNGNAAVNDAVSSFPIGETATISGQLIHLENKKVISSAQNGNTFGEVREITVTDFVNERVITGGEMQTRAEGEPRSYSIESIKAGKVAREAARSAAKKSQGKATVSSAPAATTKQASFGNAMNDFDGLDF